MGLVGSNIITHLFEKGARLVFRTALIFIKKLRVVASSATGLVSFWVRKLSALHPSMKYQNSSVSRLGL